MTRRFPSALWLAISWAVLIFCISSISGTQLQLPEVLSVSDKLLHMLLYAPLGALLALVLRRLKRAPKRFLVPMAGILTGVYGVTDEVHQSFVPGRSPEVLDAAADLVGGTLGACTAWIGVRLAQRKRTDQNVG